MEDWLIDRLVFCATTLAVFQLSRGVLYGSFFWSFLQHVLFIRIRIIFSKKMFHRHLWCSMPYRYYDIVVILYVYHTCKTSKTWWIIHVSKNLQYMVNQTIHYNIFRSWFSISKMMSFPSVDFGRPFLAHSTKISKSKDMRNRNKNNVSEWSDMSTHISVPRQIGTRTIRHLN